MRRKIENYIPTDAGGAHLYSSGLVFSFLAGYVLADQVSTRMLRNHLLSQVPVIQDRAIGGLNDFNQMGLSFSMSTEELMENYVMLLNGGVLLNLYL